MGRWKHLAEEEDRVSRRDHVSEGGWDEKCLVGGVLAMRAQK